MDERICQSESIVLAALGHRRVLRIRAALRLRYPGSTFTSPDPLDRTPLPSVGRRPLQSAGASRLAVPGSRRAWHPAIVCCRSTSAVLPEPIDRSRLEASGTEVGNRMNRPCQSRSTGADRMRSRCVYRPYTLTASRSRSGAGERVQCSSPRYSAYVHVSEL